MPKVLIITYYWPPAGSSGVQRWLKFVKYLREFGWEPVVYTAENPEVPSCDDSLGNDIPEDIEIIRKHVPEPYRIYKKLTGNNKLGFGFTTQHTQKSSLINRLAIWIRGNLFIPDARMLWINPSVRTLSKYLKVNQIDIIVSSGPPHSLHLIALKLKKRFNLPWVADFRDPWTGIYYYSSLKLTSLAHYLQRRLELKVLRNANINIVVSKSMANEFKQKGISNVEVITNGYDSLDYNRFTPTDLNFTLVHIGTIPPNSNSPLFWKALSGFARDNPDFWNSLTIRFIGDLDASVLKLIEENGLQNKTEVLGYKPHSEITLYQKAAQVLLVLIPGESKEILTGKIFEYLAAKRPIMAIGPAGGDLDILLSETKSGLLLPANDEKKMYNGIGWFWHEYKNGWSNFKPACAAGYSRRELTRKLSILLDRIIAK